MLTPKNVHTWFTLFVSSLCPDVRYVKGVKGVASYRTEYFEMEVLVWTEDAVKLRDIQYLYNDSFVRPFG
jgi:hypothetical protein